MHHIRPTERVLKRSKRLALLACLAVMAVACLVVQTEAPPVRPTSKVLTVDIVGDSLIRQATPNLRQRLSFWGYPDHTVAGFPSKAMTSPEIISALNSVRGFPRDIVVIATATNDARVQYTNAQTMGQANAESQSRQAIRSMLHSFADRCVVIVTSKENISAIYYPQQAVLYNAVLRSEAAAHLNTVVVDWATDPNTANNALFQPDLTHFGPDPSSSANTLAGADAYANAITRGVASCETKLQPTP